MPYTEDRSACLHQMQRNWPRKAGHSAALRQLLTGRVSHSRPGDCAIIVVIVQSHSPPECTSSVGCAVSRWAFLKIVFLTLAIWLAATLTYVLVANATKIAAQGDNPIEDAPFTNTPVFYALENFLANASSIGGADRRFGSELFDAPGDHLR